MYLQIKVIPKARVTEFVEKMEDGTFKIRVKAAPEKGQANNELLRFLSVALLTPKSEIKIISGQNDRRKLIKVPDDAHIPWIQ